MKTKSMGIMVLEWIGVAWLGAAGTLFSWAETTVPAKDVFTLGEIEVSGQAADHYGSVEKVYREDMEDFNADRLNEAANWVSGVTLSKVGPRNESMLYVRGLDLKHAPLFLDGIPVYVPYDGYPDLGRFTTYNLSEIVVAKGAASVLYGPNTMGGAINLVSRRPEKALEGDAGAGYASGGTYRGYLNLGSRLGAWYVQGGASLLDSQTFLLSHDFAAIPAQGGGGRNNAYQRDDTLNVRVGYMPGPKDEYALSFSKKHGVKGVPPYAGTDPTQTLRYWQWPYWNVENFRFTSQTDLGGATYLKLRGFYDIFENSLFSYDNADYNTITRPYAFKSWYDDHTDGGSLEVGSAWLPANLIRLALHYKQDWHREHNDGKPVQAFLDNVSSAGIEDTVSLGAQWTVVAGVGYNQVATVQAQDVNAMKQLVDFPHGSTSSWDPQVRVTYAPGSPGTFHASVAGKSRLPSIKDKYSYRLGSAIPNPDLQAERSVNYEAGYTGTVAERVKLAVNAFYNDVSNYILLKTVPDPSTPGKTTTQNQNVGRVRLYGAELEATAALLERLEVGANYTLLGSENQSTPDKLVDLPQHKVLLRLRYAVWEGLRLIGDAEYNSLRYSSSNAVRVAGDFFVLNLKAAYELPLNLTAEFGVENVLDRNYALQEGYPEPGRTFDARLNYKF